jgi:cytoskeletal protein CcmA (bactofilin family)
VTADFTHDADTTKPTAKGSDAPESSGVPNRSRHESTDPRRVALVPREGFFEGLVAVLGETRVEGTVRGSLRGPGELVIGPEARVEGVVECSVVSSRGTIVGPVVARSRAHFGDGAHFDGDLDAPAVEVDGDVVWNGVARVGEADPG